VLVLGGVCLNVGCSPSKALLHVASVMDEGDADAASRTSPPGIVFHAASAIDATTMEESNVSARRIADIIGVIDGIAFQTNILALNAAASGNRRRIASPRLGTLSRTGCAFFLWAWRLFMTLIKEVPRIPMRMVVRRIWNLRSATAKQQARSTDRCEYAWNANE
jgi:hypothetical protein